VSTSPDLQRAVRMAWRVLLARRIRSLPVDPLPVLRACRDTRVYTDAEAMETQLVPPSQLNLLFVEADAVTWRFAEDDRVCYIIIYRPGGNPARLRFTLAHELGHRLLGHTGSTPSEEREADCFASHLLCPEPVMRRLRADCADLSPETLAAAFYVSRACARMLLIRPASDAAPTLYTEVDDMLSAAAEQICRSIGPKTPE